MKFRTEVNLKNSDKKIRIDDAVFSIGSCFAAEISQRLKKAELQVLCNPFGTLFNPFSVNFALNSVKNNRIFTEKDLFFYNENYCCLHFHSVFDSNNADFTLNKINENIKKTRDFLRNSQWVIITYGTSYIYEYIAENQFVANCRKIPQKFFLKRFLTHDEIIDNISQTIDTLQDICPENLQILFTVSPVRHTKDGMTENLLSKSKLIVALHEVLENRKNCTYLPVYEIVMDDLRDYRFYKEDLVHIANQSVTYIWEKFTEAYFSEETKLFAAENLKIKKSLEHRPNYIQSIQYQEFIDKLKEKIAEQQKKTKHEIFSGYL